MKKLLLLNLFLMLGLFLNATNNNGRTSVKDNLAIRSAGDVSILSVSNVRSAKTSKITHTSDISSSFSSLSTSKTSDMILLNRNWEFTQFGKEEWKTATVPGTVHQDLISHGLLPDPFYGTNEKKIQWVENEDWEYRTTFSVTEQQLEQDAALLTFEGLDTYADVYLNGALLFKCDNMFVGHSVPVKSVLKKGVNRLHIYFHSPIKQTLPQWNSNGFNYPADNDHHPKHLSIFTRKAPYSYGWDWGIRMVTSGIWRPITLQFYNVARIDDFFVKQTHLSDEKAQLSNELPKSSVKERISSLSYWKRRLKY